MARKRVEFVLHMGVPSTVGSSSYRDGPPQHLALVRSMSESQIDELGIPTSFFYRWEDGWSCSIGARVMESGERRRKSDGFDGYDWMVDSIEIDGEIVSPEDRKRKLQEHTDERTESDNG